MAGALALLRSAGAGASFAASISPVGGSSTGTVDGDSTIITTDPFTGIPADGASPYSYAWAFVSGDMLVTPNTPAAATTTFSFTVPSAYGTFTAIMRLTITDGSSATATADMTVIHTNSADTGGFGELR